MQPSDRTLVNGAGESSREHVEALIERIDLLKTKLPKPKGGRRSPQKTPKKEPPQVISTRPIPQLWTVRWCTWP